jgi:hypothetical protein
MNRQTSISRDSIRNAALAFIGLTALIAYIIACASFSPDDARIVFPAYDPMSGQIGVGLYDRKRRTTEQLFVLPIAQVMSRDDLILRPQWTPDGRYVIVAWPVDSNMLCLQVLPLGRAGPTRLLMVPGIERAYESLSMPLPLVGSRLFLTCNSNILRLDFETGAIMTNSTQGELSLYSSLTGDRVYYARAGAGQDGGLEVGQLDVERLTLTRLVSLPKELVSEGELVGISQDGRRTALLSEKGGKTKVLVCQGDRLETTLDVGTAESGLKLGHVQWSPDGRTLYAPYSEAANTTNRSLGVLEMPMYGRPTRRIPLLTAQGEGDGSDMRLFQIALSHDGKTIAATSTYLAREEKLHLRAEDCALFLVDLAKRKRPVSRMRLPLPQKPAGAPNKT